MVVYAADVELWALVMVMNAARDDEDDAMRDEIAVAWVSLRVVMVAEEEEQRDEEVVTIDSSCS